MSSKKRVRKGDNVRINKNTNITINNKKQKTTNINNTKSAAVAQSATGNINKTYNKDSDLDKNNCNSKILVKFSDIMKRTSKTNPRRQANNVNVNIVDNVTNVNNVNNVTNPNKITLPTYLDTINDNHSKVQDEVLLATNEGTDETDESEGLMATTQKNETVNPKHKPSSDTKGATTTTRTPYGDVQLHNPQHKVLQVQRVIRKYVYEDMKVRRIEIEEATSHPVMTVLARYVGNAQRATIHLNEIVPPLSLNQRKVEKVVRKQRMDAVSTQADSNIAGTTPNIRTPDAHNVDECSTDELGQQPSIFEIPRVQQEDEHLLRNSTQRELRHARAIGLKMGIHPQQIFAHIDSLRTKDPENPSKKFEEADRLWFASADVGHAIQQTIPRAITSGFERDDEFSEALFEMLTIELKETFETGFNVAAFADDIKEFTKDPNLVQYLLYGVPQSYCGRFETVFHRNLPMNTKVTEKLRARRDKQIELGNCSELMIKDKLKEILGRIMSNPAGAVIKNRAERIKMMNGEDHKHRPIYHGSKMEDGQSLNSQTHTNHDIKFVRFQDIEAAILDAVDRIHELGFESHFNRVRCWKSDISDAYRIIRTAVADRWLGIWGLAKTMDDGSKVMEYVIEKCQQFGQRKSVTIFSRLVYQITAIMSQKGWNREYFPTMSLDGWDGQETSASRPPAKTIEEALKKFKAAKEGSGVLDPDVFFWLAYYLDDCHGISIDVRDDISKPLEADPVTGIRNPIGKAIAFFLQRYNITENIEKRILENDELLMGSTDFTALGIRIDINALRCYVRADYRTELLNDITFWLNNPRKAHSAEEWGSMEGRLGFCMIVYNHFRCLLRPMWRNYAAILNTNASACCAGKIILRSLFHIRRILELNPGRALKHNRKWRTTFQQGLNHCFKDPSTMDLLSDASGNSNLGFGIVNTKTGEYYYRKWNGREIELANRKKIYILEAAATFIMFKINAPYLSETNINLETWNLNIIGDNMGLVKSFHSTGSKSSPLVNDIICEMVVDLSIYDITLNCDTTRFNTAWCDTNEMKAADALSRGKLDEFKHYMETNFPKLKLICLNKSDPRVRDAEAQWDVLLRRDVTKEGYERNTSTKNPNQIDLR